jgi:hypothetical protein
VRPGSLGELVRGAEQRLGGLHLGAVLVSLRVESRLDRVGHGRLGAGAEDEEEVELVLLRDDWS